MCTVGSIVRKFKLHNTHQTLPRKGPRKCPSKAETCIKCDLPVWEAGWKEAINQDTGFCGQGGALLSKFKVLWGCFSSAGIRNLV